MIELPETVVAAQQINETISGKRILNVTAAQSPHKFAWYHGDPQKYHELLAGKAIGRAVGIGGHLDIKAEDAVILLNDGINLRYHEEKEERPQKHQLLIEFEDYSALSASVQMYGGICCFKEGKFDNKYYQQAKDRPSPLSDRFDKAYFDGIISAPGAEGLSAKALLATEQRVPGLGNGVLQDILFNAGIHPKRKVKTFSEEDKDKIFGAIKSTLAEMTFQGGRDTERDLFGCTGGYKTRLSKNTVGKLCNVCGGIIKKEAYMGGSIYFCTGCQRL
ncbi:MAG: endonuclease VIII [Ruminiclostridium sp.]|nr:endonuclease VIII [Ruminiclostridium sp.]